MDLHFDNIDGWIPVLLIDLHIRLNCKGNASGLFPLPNAINHYPAERRCHIKRCLPCIESITPGCGEADIEGPGIHLSPICLGSLSCFAAVEAERAPLPGSSQGLDRAAMPGSTLSPALLRRSVFRPQSWERTTRTEIGTT